MTICRDGLCDACNIGEIAAIVVQAEIEYQTISLFVFVAVHIHFALLILAESTKVLFF